MGKRIKSVPRRNDSFKFNVGLGKKKKDSAIRPKISSNRMTVLPGFLSQGVKSIATKKLEAEENNTNENILKEDLHSLFINNQENSSRSRRRSARLLERTIVNNAPDSPRKRKYPKQNKLTSPKSSALQIPSENTAVPKYFPLLENPNGADKKESLICRSLFKKIISSQSLSNSISYFKSFFSNKNQCAGEDFNRNVLDKLQINYKVNIVENLRGKIFEEIGKVNDILLGKVDPTRMGSFMKLTQGNMDDMEHQVPEYLFPSSDWQFATPPSQKLNITFYEESAIQPAILCNDGTARNIYQLKREIDTNLINHINPNNIEVDNRYMEQIAEFDKENLPLRNFCLNKNKSADRKKEEFDFKPKFMNRYLREHLASTQMRPRKTVKRLRFADSFTRNQMALMEAGLSKPSTSVYDPLAMETSELDFTFVNCLKESDSSESPKSHTKLAPRMDIFSCLDNAQNIFNSIDSNE